MGGQTRTKLTCANCGQETMFFEPYQMLSLPIPADHNIDILFTVVPRNKGSFYKYGLTINKFATLGALHQEIERLTKIPSTKFVVASVYQNKINLVYNFSDDEPLIRLGIRAGENLYVYEVHKNIEDAEQDMRVNAYDSRKKWGNFAIGDQIDAADPANKW